ncbi:hypothetical protein CPB83DRAFT_860409 [Crepidotus variabilis]|uniref:Uncharacterized protein n=1 Tax=Crepidotus variabilis TaxID=179855 RepID=A0A9P6E9P9_9AGAR|nr:hypothetical protein CPB83DRAFT_860409 [Crepidotus variabilis]
MVSSNAFASTSARASSRSVSLPVVPELLNPNFLDALLPAKPTTPKDLTEVSSSNPMMEALKASSQRTLTANGAAAFSGTDSPTVDAFSSLSQYTSPPDLHRQLEKAWVEDANLTLRIIWNLRSIHDGKGEKEAFYRAFGWLYDNHPRTAISNLHMLVNPTCQIRNKKSQGAHGYWKDLLNLLALATVDELSSPHSKFLHSEREKYTYPSKHHVSASTPAERIEMSLANDAHNKEQATKERHTKYERNYQRLVQKLSQPKFRALYIAVARLFSEQLVKDFKVMHAARELGPDEDKIAFLKQLSLAAKWAPTPGGSHDRITNISTAIVELIYQSQVMFAYPSVLNTPLEAEKRAQVLRSFFQRWVLTELRQTSYCIEPLMSANRWKEISYNRVPSICMKNNTERFFKHDSEGFQNYLISVEQGKKKISGATLLPHELVAQVIKLSLAGNSSSSKSSALQEVKKKLAETEARVAEAQWKTLISNLRESGSIENSIAVCDVSGSMGSIYDCGDKRFGVSPILPAVSLSLVLAALAKPPFNGGFITFSSRPQFVTLDLNTPLQTQIERMVGAHWSMNTDFSAVFLDLLLPLAIQNKVKQEDMIKRIFIFSDMQFDAAGQMSDEKWKTNHDTIEKAYKEAGYEAPQIVYWDLSTSGNPTREVQDSGREGVAMMNGFSPAMLKVFVGEKEEDTMEWEKVTEDGESTTVVEKNEAEAFNPVNVMKKALMKQSFDGLVVVD